MVIVGTCGYNWDLWYLLGLVVIEWYNWEVYGIMKPSDNLSDMCIKMVQLRGVWYHEAKS